MDNNEQNPQGKIGQVSGAIGPNTLGEVIISIRGGSEAFLARAENNNQEFKPGERVLILEYHAPRNVIVTNLLTEKEN